MRKILLLTLIVAVTCGAAAFVLVSRPETGQFDGLTATVVTEMVNAKMGKDGSANGYTVAVRPNGDESTLEVSGGITSFRIVKTRTQHYWFDPESKTISTFYQKPGTFSVWRRIDPTCESHPDIVGIELLGHGTFYGLPVVKWRQRSRAPNGDILELETWEAPAIGCREIYSDYIRSSADGTVLAETRNMLVDLKFGEPDPSLFDPPAGSAEVRPSELQRSFEAARGLPTLYAPSLNEKRDNRYAESQKYKQ